MGQTYRDDPSPHQKFRRMETLSGITSVFTEIHDNSLDVALISILISLQIFLTQQLGSDCNYDLLCSIRYNAHET